MLRNHAPKTLKAVSLFHICPATTSQCGLLAVRSRQRTTHNFAAKCAARDFLKQLGQLLARRTSLFLRLAALPCRSRGQTSP